MSYLPVLCLLALSCAKAPASTAAATAPASTPASAATEPAPATEVSAATEPFDHGAADGVDDPALAALLEEAWAATMDRYPTWAVQIGDTAHRGELYDGSPAARERFEAQQDDWMARLEALDPLSGDDAITAELLRFDLSAAIATRACRFEAWSISPRDQPLVEVNRLVQDHALDTPAHGDDLLVQLSATATNIDHRTAALRAGLADGLTANAESVRRVVTMLDDALSAGAEGSPMVVSEAPEGWPAAAWASFSAANVAVVDDEVHPALARLRDLLRDEVLPVARTGEAVGLGGLPLGEACYAALIERHTTLPLDADELHQTGLDELQRIHAEFAEVGARVWEPMERAELFARLRTDPALRFDTAEEIEATARDALARAEAAVPDAFGRLPQTPCEVRPIPDYLAPYTTIAYYERPRPGQGLPGYYAVNTYQPETRPRHEAEVLAFHEAVPGHHLQIALNQELPALPAFRRHSQATAFVEGWALYTERLSDELGLYSGDTDRLGMLSFDAWRAARLAVDTGLHAKGWTREQAVAFLEEQTPLATNNIDNEVDRYITTPGQALAYKTGQLSILALRAEAEQALGEAFDLSAFHDVVLGGGGVTLPVLEGRVRAWIASQQP